MVEFSQFSEMVTRELLGNLVELIRNDSKRLLFLRFFRHSYVEAAVHFRRGARRGGVLGERPAEGEGGARAPCPARVCALRPPAYENQGIGCVCTWVVILSFLL